MTTVEYYPRERQRLVALAGTLSVEQSREPVPALPGWTIKDAYAHLTGLCADIVDGRMDEAGSPAWTTRQVQERGDRSLAEVCAEWSDRGPALDAWLEDRGEGDATFVVFDVWTHEQDIRSTLGVPRVANDPPVPYLVDQALTAFDRRFRDAEAPALRVITATADRTLGAGPPGATVRVSDYELLRILFGRRTTAQMVRADWDGDPKPYLAHLHLFEEPRADLDD